MVAVEGEGTAVLKDALLLVAEELEALLDRVIVVHLRALWQLATVERGGVLLSSSLLLLVEQLVSVAVDLRLSTLHHLLPLHAMLVLFAELRKLPALVIESFSDVIIHRRLGASSALLLPLGEVVYRALLFEDLGLERALLVELRLLVAELFLFLLLKFLNSLLEFYQLLLLLFLCGLIVLNRMLGDAKSV